MIVRLEDPDDPRLDDYRNLTDASLRHDRGVFIAEGRLVVRTLLSASRYRPRSLLLTDAAMESLRDVVPPEDGAGPPVYIIGQDAMNRVAGFNIHRGCLAAGERGRDLSPADVLHASAGRTIVVIEGVNNHDNIGGVFRNAAAFGAGGVLLDRGCVDPLYRKAIRVSMGGVLRVPFACFDQPEWGPRLAPLRAAGYAVLALTPGPDAINIREFGSTRPLPERVALMLGAEGEGLSKHALAAADARVRISIVECIDSLNVAAAAGIALHWFAP